MAHEPWAHTPSCSHCISSSNSAILGRHPSGLIDIMTLRRQSLSYIAIPIFTGSPISGEDHNDTLAPVSVNKDGGPCRCSDQSALRGRTRRQPSVLSLPLLWSRNRQIRRDYLFPGSRSTRAGFALMLDAILLLLAFHTYVSTSLMQSVGCSITAQPSPPSLLLSNRNLRLLSGWISCSTLSTLNPLKGTSAYLLSSGRADLRTARPVKNCIHALSRHRGSPDPRHPLSRHDRSQH
ncbi:hypothetical protein BX600DRAFT_133142 [Xylariales sp. PMI_506]|nr:hypothetical protein BX600DRAFT_133142 [Xylariales sp. PMI_506]